MSLLDIKTRFSAMALKMFANQHVFRLPPLTQRTMWLGLCFLQGMLGVSLIHKTQDNATVVLLALIVWWGAALVIEDCLHLLPSRQLPVYQWIGALILVFCSWRAFATFHLDIMAYLLFPLQAIGCCLLASPDRRMWEKLWKPIVILSLFAVQIFVQRALPMPIFTAGTAKFVEFLLSLFDVGVLASGSVIHHANGSVNVVDGCSGLDLAIQVSTTAVIFVLAFPLDNALSKIFSLLVAPFIALFVNAFRISLLTFVNSTQWANRDMIFAFLHDQWGALLFAGLAMSIYCMIYMRLIDRQISASTD